MSAATSSAIVSSPQPAVRLTSEDHAEMKSNYMLLHRERNKCSKDLDHQWSGSGCDWDKNGWHARVWLGTIPQGEFEQANFVSEARAQDTFQQDQIFFSPLDTFHRRLNDDILPSPESNAPTTKDFRPRRSFLATYFPKALPSKLLKKQYPAYFKWRKEADVNNMASVVGTSLPGRDWHNGNLSGAKNLATFTYRDESRKNVIRSQPSAWSPEPEEKDAARGYKEPKGINPQLLEWSASEAGWELRVDILQSQSLGTPITLERYTPPASYGTAYTDRYLKKLPPPPRSSELAFQPTSFSRNPQFVRVEAEYLPYDEPAPETIQLMYEHAFDDFDRTHPLVGKNIYKVCVSEGKDSLSLDTAQIEQIENYDAWNPFEDSTAAKFQRICALEQLRSELMSVQAGMSSLMVRKPDLLQELFHAENANPDKLGEILSKDFVNIPSHQWSPSIVDRTKYPLPVAPSSRSDPFRYEIQPTYSSNGHLGTVWMLSDDNERKHKPWPSCDKTSVQDTTPAGAGENTWYQCTCSLCGAKMKAARMRASHLCSDCFEWEFKRPEVYVPPHTSGISIEIVLGRSGYIMQSRKSFGRKLRLPTEEELLRFLRSPYLGPFYVLSSHGNFGKILPNYSFVTLDWVVRTYGIRLPGNISENDVSQSIKMGVMLWNRMRLARLGETDDAIAEREGVTRQAVSTFLQDRSEEIFHFLKIDGREELHTIKSAPPEVGPWRRVWPILQLTHTNAMLTS